MAEVENDAQIRAARVKVAEQLAAMKNLTDEELMVFGKFLVSASVEHCAPVPVSKKLKLEEEQGTGPALAAFLKRAVDFRYITQAEHDRIIARISSIASIEEREVSTVAAMRRFIAIDQPLGGRMVLVGCPVRHKNYPDLGSDCFTCCSLKCFAYYCCE